MPKIPVKPRELPEPGTYVAVCMAFIDKGTQTPNNPQFSPTRQCEVPFELQGIKRKDGKPFELAVRTSYSANSRSNFVKMFGPWLGIAPKNGGEIDTDDFLGRPAMVTVTHSDDGQYANITNVSAVPSKTKVAKPSKEPFAFYLDEDHFDAEVLETLTEKQQEQIKSSPEYQELNRTAPKKAPAAASNGKAKAAAPAKK